MTLLDFRKNLTSRVCLLEIRVENYNQLNRPPADFFQDF